MCERRAICWAVTHPPRSARWFLVAISFGASHGRPRRLMAHRGHVHSVEFSPDGQTLVTAGSDGEVSIWEVATGRRRATLRSGVREVNFAGYSPDGKTIAAAETGGKLRLWDVEQKRSLSAWDNLASSRSTVWPGRRTVAIWRRPVSLASFSWFGRWRPVRLGRCGRDIPTRSISLRIPRTAGAWPRLPATKASAFGISAATISCVWNPTRRTSHAFGSRQTARPWPRRAPREQSRFGTSPTAVSPPRTRPTPNALTHFRSRHTTPSWRLAIISASCREWDWKNDRIVRVIDSDQGRILSLAYSPVANNLASTAREGSLCIWDFAADVPSREIASGGSVGSLAFTQDSRQLVFAGPSPGVSILDLETCSRRVLPTGSPNPAAHLATARARVFLTRDDRLSALQVDLAGIDPLVTVATFEAHYRFLAGYA